MEEKGCLVAGLIFICILFYVSFTIATETENDVMTVEANIFEPVASVSVSDYIVFGDVTEGYKIEDIKVNVSNTGTTDIKITPKLDNATEVIFSYIYLQRRTTDNYFRIGDFSMNISKPSSFGDREDDYLYMKLDLTNYSGVDNDMLNHNTTITFYAMSN